MSRTIIDIHILQTVPPSNLNRDDTGSPKTAVYGGERRARVSSQAWKRATRSSFKATLDGSDLGVRSKRLVEIVAERMLSLDGGLAETAVEHAQTVVNEAGIKTKTRKKDEPQQVDYLVFLSEWQLDALAQAGVSAVQAGGDLKVTLKQANLKSIADQHHSIDIALFGRMVADLPELNVDAAAQVAHAISVHRVENEYDYFTAVDDRKTAEEDAGAAMIGTVEFNSATLYRYATVDVDRLRDNLGDAEATERAVRAFVQSFVTSMPTGKQNTFANRTLPDAVLVTVSGNQSINLVGAFEQAVSDSASAGLVSAAAKRLSEHAAQVHEAYGTAPDRAWLVAVGAAAGPLAGAGTAVSLQTLVSEVGGEVNRRLAEPA